MDIPTLIPESIVRWMRAVASGPLFDTLWKMLILAAAVLVILYMFAVGGPIVGGIAGILLFVIASDRIRQLFIDIYERNFWMWRR
jgi:hypothetical protein